MGGLKRLHSTIFDESIFRIFGDIPHCLNQGDDILLGGKDILLGEVLKTLLQRAKITYNREKYRFEREEIEFFGDTFTKDGLKPSAYQVKAVQECAAPKSKEEGRSFFGMGVYYDNFIDSPCHNSCTSLPTDERDKVPLGQAGR